MKIFNNNLKVFSMIFAVALLTPMLASAAVHFIENTNDNAVQYENIRPCFVDYPLTTCPTGKSPQNKCPKDARYFKSCSCGTQYQYTSSNCTGGKVLGGGSCDGKYESCTCGSQYRYTSSNCTGGKVVGGNSCDGKYETCGCSSQYSQTCSSPLVGSGSSCDGRYSSCRCPSNYVTCNNGGAVGASSCNDGTTKWTQCKAAPKCADGGFLASMPNNQTCTQIAHEGLTCYKDCKTLGCGDGGYLSSVPVNHTCTQITYNSNTCYKNCIAPGYILYSDKTISYERDKAKTPIGIVVDPARRYAMALKCSLKQWANNGTNKNNISEIPDKTEAEAANDYNGKALTKIIVDKCGSSCPAAYYAYNYTTAGTSKGDWYLPSGGQLVELQKHVEEINVGLAKSGGNLPYGNNIYTYVESSNEAVDIYDFKMSIFLDLEKTNKPTPTLQRGNKYKSAYLEKDFSCPFINF